MRQPWLVLYLTLCLRSGCAAADAAATVPTSMPAAAPAAAPTEQVLVEAPAPRYVAPTLRDLIGRVWAPVYLNGEGPFRLVLDTGATSSAITAAVAHRLKIPIDPNRVVNLHGATGASVVPFVDIERMEVGDLDIEDVALPIVPDVFGGAEGVLGSRGLLDKRILIDFRHDNIEITLARAQQNPLGYAVLPFTLVRGRLITLDVEIGSIRTKAIIDTGAQQTIGNSALRAALIKRGRQARAEDIIGVTLDIAHGDSMPTPTIIFGELKITNLRVTFGDMFIFEQWGLNERPVLLIGMDLIGSVDTLIIDYKKRQLLVRARS